MKVAINACYGGFHLSNQAHDLYYQLTGEACDEWDRADPHLIQVIEQLGEAANCGSSKIKIIEIPNDLYGNWSVVDHDGKEHVAEKHRTWR